MARTRPPADTWPNDRSAITTGTHTIRDHIAVLEAWLHALDPDALAAVRQVVTPDTPADACIDYAFRLEAAIRMGRATRPLRPVRGGDPEDNPHDDPPAR
ncbi:hypothetical protein GQ464_002260 [Rhodocaloribacter litoris]|uniref:hypothetical protein n=1 Tax=Rhodocaloribacter litoris TaxID=2558931 RepID=UPI0014214374|nr:hypothetical protein [Rhodocaloribacter litoris]QXD15793.1 hypothetical protein GQ464_002260 [Rhodocaloribacter litoris]